jgi:MscS family membrane protein
MQQELTEFLNGQSWLFPVAVIIAVLVINRLVHWLLNARLLHAHPHRAVWRHAVLFALNAPVRALIWLLGAALIKQRFLPQGVQVTVDRFYAPTMGILTILVFVWFLLRLVERFKDNYIAAVEHREQDIDRTAVDAISKLAWAVILVFGIISILQQLKVPLASLLAFGGAAGIAVGFAAQTLVANLFGGLTVYASRIFKIGEDIIFPNTKLAGTVQKIGWRATRVLGWDGKPFYVPNSLFNSSNMVNHSRLSHRTISEYLQLHYRDLDKVKDIVREGNALLQAREDIGYFVFRFSSFGDATLKLYVYAWAQTVPAGFFLPYADFMRIKEEILLAIADIARKHGCNLILPVTHVYLPNGVEPAKSEWLPAGDASLQEPPEPH